MSKKHKTTARTYELVIKSLSHEGRGIAHFDNKVIFVSGALPGETVIAKQKFSRTKFAETDVQQVLKPADNRITPKCKFFGICGGCSLQHLSREDQIKVKQEWLKDTLLSQAKIEPKLWLKPLQGDSWGYHRKARLGVRYVTKKNKVLVGFREKKSSFITDMNSCKTLLPSLGEKLNTLAKYIGKLLIKSKIPQIEVAITENDTVLIIRHLMPLTHDDAKILTDCANELDIKFYLQSGGLETIKPLNQTVVLNYSHPKHDIVMKFLPTDFTQVNFNLNQKMINLALDILNLNQSDKVIDLFCGLGNFTLPIAKYAQHVIGIEGDTGLIERAKHNAYKNNINNVDFYKANLFEVVEDFEWFRNKTYNKTLIDPTRSGGYGNG